MRSPIAFAAAVLLALACGGSKQGGEQLAPLPSRPLAGLAGLRVVVIPVHYLRPADSLGWAASIDRPREFLATVDDEIAFALGERGFRTNWVFADALARSARRNATYAADPYALAAEGLRPLARRPADGQINEPLASQVRSLVALHDARYALFPVELRFEKVEAAGRAVVRVALIDARLSRVRWMRDVASDTASALSPAMAASVADRLADLIATP